MYRKQPRRLLDERSDLLHIDPGGNPCQSLVAILILQPNSCISEYLACHIFELLGIKAQKTLLGTYTDQRGREKVQTGAAVIDWCDLRCLAFLVYQDTPVAIVTVKVSQQRVKEQADNLRKKYLFGESQEDEA